MQDRKKIFAIIGSASKQSSNLKLVEQFADLTQDVFDINILNDLKYIPHFSPEESINNTPKEVLDLRESIANADGIVICTPEYIFSIPSGLKNLIEWCVSTTVFSMKPTGLITASASGYKGHEELKLIMKTVYANFNEQTTLLIQGIKGKISDEGIITDPKTREDLNVFIEAYKLLVLSALPEIGEGVTV